MAAPRSYTKAFPPPPATFAPEDCRAIGFEFHNERSAYTFLDAAGKSQVRVDFSPTLAHQALLVKGPEDWSGALLWVNGEPVPVPRDQDQNPLCEKSAEWLDDRFVYARVGGLWDHPLLNPRKIDALGNLRGFLVWDALTRERQLLIPEPHEAWTDPVLLAREDSWAVFADRQALHDNRPDRILSQHK